MQNASFGMIRTFSGKLPSPTIVTNREFILRRVRRALCTVGQTKDIVTIISGAMECITNKQEFTGFSSFGDNSLILS
jgi:hypothetical protein